MAENMRKTGIDILGDLPWGTHFCQFYQTKEDLIDILVPYFKAGLENNEFCMWITSEPLTVEEAKDAMEKNVSDFERYLTREQIEIIPHTEWYLKGGVFNLRRVLTGWVDKLDRALARGCEGMRITGNTAWLGKNDWRSFADYEEEIDNVIGRYQMMAICSYSLDKCKAHEIIDVVRNHQFALIKREGKLELFESSERKRAKEALRKSEEKYRILYETIKDGIVATDMDGRILEYNQAYADMLGYSKEEIRKLTYQQLTPEKWHKMEAVKVKELIVARGYSDEYEKEYVRKDGTVFPISIRVWLIRDEDGKPKGMWGIIREITERKRMEEALRKLSNAIEQSPCSIVITDTKGNIEYVNPKFCKITGYTQEEAIGQNPRVLKSDAKPPEEYKCLWDTITSGREWEGEFYNKKKTGELYWEFASISPIRNPEGVITHFVAVKEDITERKRAEDELRKQRDHLENLTRQLTASNKELEAFCYSVSHDLRAPLRSINGFSKALMEDCSDKLDSQGKNYLQRVMAASQYMGQLIDDLLNLSRITRSEARCKTVDLSALAKKIVTELREAQPERQAEFVIHERLIANGDPQLLRIALMNLLSNAWKFTRNRPCARIELGVTRHDEKPVYFVRDNGVGFDMAFVNKLFGAFQRLHATSEYEGTGIGLATVQRIINRHGGQIWAEGAVDQGATFYFTI
jgi:PAS domain S-box-containing protein